MSKLRKPASFRSRIPIRKNLFKRAQGDEFEYDGENLSLRKNRNFELEKNIINSKGAIVHPGCNYLTIDCPYSTYSSNDESDESEVPYKKISNKYTITLTDDFMYTSTDAISLDGLLDTVSCGSNFSLPPSPVQYQNIGPIMASKNLALESMDVEYVNIPIECQKNHKYLANDIRIHRLDSISTNLNSRNNCAQVSEQNKPLSLKATNSKMVSLMQTTECESRPYRDRLESQITKEHNNRKPMHTLSLPRKSLSNNTTCSPEDISVNNNVRNEFWDVATSKIEYPSYCFPTDTSIPTATTSITKPMPPYYCPPSYTPLVQQDSENQKDNTDQSSTIKLSVKDLQKRYQQKSLTNNSKSPPRANFNCELKTPDSKHISTNVASTSQPNERHDDTANKNYIISSTAFQQITQSDSKNIFKTNKIPNKTSDRSCTQPSLNENLLPDQQSDASHERVEVTTKFNSHAPAYKQRQIQLQLQQNPQTRQLFAVIQEEVFQPKTPIVYNRNEDISGSYASLECPSPPGPPTAISEAQKDPQVELKPLLHKVLPDCTLIRIHYFQIRLSNYLRNMYQELAFNEQNPPEWAKHANTETLCPARFEPELRLNSNSHGISDYLTIDQLMVSIQTKDGSFLESPRRCLIECPAWTSRNYLCLRILNAWAKGHPWPIKGTPIALTLFIPLLELKRSFAHFLEKELLPKGTSSPLNNIPGGFCAVWSSLEALGPKLLIILDGYTSQKHLSTSGNNIPTPRKLKIGGAGRLSSVKHQFPSDVYELLDGKLFPEARIIILTNSSNCTELMPIVQRHVMYEGLTWGRSASILERGHWGGPSRLINKVHENLNLRQAIRTPLGCLAIAAIYDGSNGHLPTEELDVVESIFNCVAPEVLNSNVSELGRLALFCLKTKRTYITLAEVKMYCSTADSIMGCLEKNVPYGKTAKKKGDFVFYPICHGMMEYLAANYIASLAHRPGVLSAEITGMAISDDLDADLLKVLKYTMSLLGEQAHILLSRLTPLWLSPQMVFTLALAGGHGDENMATLCDILGISKHPPISPLETKPLWVQVRSVATDLMGWGMALKSSTCTLKNLELIYQLEKQSVFESRKAVDIFLEAISDNESVTTLRLSSLIEMDAKDSEISYLANCVSKLLLKPRLESFELVLTLIEEDPPVLKLQSVVAALCRSLPHQTKLNSLLLDLGLCTSQLVQVCAALDKCPNLARLSLPHLRCERGAISTLASLLKSRHISFLFLPSCWGARDDPPSSSGVSMGSGSGSSTGTSCLIKQGSLPGVPSPRSYAPGVFSSLPRGMLIPQTSLGRSATLPRQPLDQTLEKRSCESVVSKLWYPTPSCDGVPHNSGTLHDLFVVIRDSYSKLHGLDLSKAQLSLEDSMCLGETVRVSNTLHSLKLEGLSRISDILPSILGASESSCLQMLSIGSQRLNLDDSVVVMCAKALTSCSTLRLLSIDGWCLRIDHLHTLSALKAFLSLTSIRELSLANCRIHTCLIKGNAKIPQMFESRSVVVLKLSGAQMLLPDLSSLRGPQLLQFMSGFPCLRELDLSAPSRSGIESTRSSPLILDDKSIINFFQNVHNNFGLLNTLKICNWVIHFDDMTKTVKTVGKSLRNSPISHLKIDGISILDRPKKKRCESAFIHCFFTSLSHLRWMGISLSGKKEDQITAIGNAVTDLKGSEIEIKLSESTIEQAKLMAQVISIDGKFDIKVSTFGTSSGILIHAEKCGIKSLNRKNKDKEH